MIYFHFFKDVPIESFTFSDSKSLCLVLYEISSRDLHFSLSILSSLLAFLNEDFFDLVVRIFINHLTVEKDYIENFLVPILIQNLPNFSHNTLPQIARLFCFLWRSPDQALYPEWLSQLLAMNDDSITFQILDILLQEKSIPFSEIFIATLSILLQIPVEDSTCDVNTENILDILSTIAACHREKYIPLSFQLIDQTENLGLKLKLLYPCLFIIPNSLDFLD
jgi:hypothetical protein